MIFLVRTVVWFSLVLAFLPPGFRITPDHAVYEMILNVLPEDMAVAVETPAPKPEIPSICEDREWLCNLSEDAGLLLDIAGEEAQNRISDLAASDTASQ